MQKAQEFSFNMRKPVFYKTLKTVTKEVPKNAEDDK